MENENTKELTMKKKQTQAGCTPFFVNTRNGWGKIERRAVEKLIFDSPPFLLFFSFLLFFFSFWCQTMKTKYPSQHLFVHS